jgi:hypothetical protein
VLLLSQYSSGASSSYIHETAPYTPDVPDLLSWRHEHISYIVDKVHPREIDHDRNDQEKDSERT